MSARTSRRRRRRQQEEEYSDDEEESESMFPAWKTAAVLGIIVVCFAILYPKMFHPMLMFALGMNQKTQPEDNTKQMPPHPAMRGGRPPPSSHIHSGPPPNMRMANQAGGQGDKGSSKGMWHWMLPFYTIGVIVFLLYTLSKILWKKPKDRRSPKLKYNLRYNSNRDKFEVGDPSETSSEEDDKGIPGRLSSRELKGLQTRLRHTEDAMHKILEQLEQLSGAVDDNTAETIKQSTLETLNNLSAANAEEETQENRRRGSGSPRTSGEQKYMADLEKALSDFKILTENYVQQAQNKANQPPEESEKEATVSEAKNPEESEEEEEENDEKIDENGFDAMEGEDPEHLSVPEGEGEIIHLDNTKNADPDEIMQGVRKRH